MFKLIILIGFENEFSRTAGTGGGATCISPLPPYRPSSDKMGNYTITHHKKMTVCGIAEGGGDKCLPPPKKNLYTCLTIEAVEDYSPNAAEWCYKAVRYVKTLM